MLVVAGTGTGVGKTAVTAAVAALHPDRAAALKPAQTGAAPGEAGDADAVAHLAPGTAVCELARYPDPLAPATAARRAGRAGVRAVEAARAARALAREHALVLVEGAGGPLVRLHGNGDTLADVAAELGAPVLLVTRAGLGTLNDTAAAAEALAARGLTCLGTVIGSWPARPGLAARCNIADLPEASGLPLLGALPEGAARLCPRAFSAAAAASLTPRLGGRCATPPPPRPRVTCGVCC
ncbi:ATP-dependent dethiobiotin synthetase BioD [Streptomonospora wellingtoniae]|uniref:ATP-dependent dethiobiotin synthetase BioD n=1 Tax=Streptomonospora wellingtoniae TaxID=3075544 RepID=A0ABU2L0G1_9ACTN|nr:dethiobiotin synthase [Streptomonospora sp. DSM 45055]MDT0304901.1 dethiobiotin synthase [Streptomonospora sp. DSM 45055]